jgi:hypothetical protein
MKWCLIFLSLLVAVSLGAQEDDSLNWDIDSLFDEPLPESPVEESPEDGASGLSALGLVRRRGFTFDASFEFMAGLAPGWEVPFWFSTDEDEDAFSWGPAVKMTAKFGLDAQISEFFRVKTLIGFSIPNFTIKLDDFFFDYSLYDKVFFRGGKYNHSWGISPNYSFANLLSRVPKKGLWGDSYIFKADVPIGIGGIQALALTRANLAGGILPGWSDIGYGAKYNLALRWADFDIGVFYQEGMALRGFMSIKTTIGKTELYNEWMAVIHSDNEAASGAGNVGVVRDFFGGKLSVNGELFYNAEKDSYWYRPESGFREADTSPFVEGFNVALNLLYRFGGKLNPRLFLQMFYTPLQNSAQVVPGFRLSLWPYIEFYFAVPMGLGDRNSYYYSHTADPHDRPFSVVMLLTLTGGVRAVYNY